MQIEKVAHPPRMRRVWQTESAVARLRGAAAVRGSPVIHTAARRLFFRVSSAEKVTIRKFRNPGCGLFRRRLDG